MAKSSTSLEANTQLLKRLAATVHTYESLGRAIVSHVLAASASAPGSGSVSAGKLQAEFAVHPSNPTATEADHDDCVVVSVGFGDQVYWIEICDPIHIGHL
jgi:hypothetical protein